MDSLFACLRDVVASDLLITAQLYRSTRSDLLALPLPAAHIEELIRSQQQIQLQGIHLQFPQAQTRVLEIDGAVVARMVYALGNSELRLIDISVFPESQGRGFARYMIEQLKQMAKAHQLPITLRVFNDHLRAKKIYHAAGFEVMAADEMSHEMIWQQCSATCNN